MKSIPYIHAHKITVRGGGFGGNQEREVTVPSIIAESVK